MTIQSLYKKSFIALISKPEIHIKNPLFLESLLQAIKKQGDELEIDSLLGMVPQNLRETPEFKIFINTIYPIEADAIKRFKAHFDAKNPAGMMLHLANIKDAKVLSSFTDDHGHTPFKYACFSGNKPLATALLDKGVPINETQGKGTPLIQAFLSKSEELSLELIERGADLQSVDETDSWMHGFSSKVILALNKRGLFIDYGILFEVAPQEVILDLIQEKVFDVNMIFKGGRTPLTEACNKNWDQVVLALINAGADINMPTRNSLVQYPLEILIQKKSLSLIEYFLSLKECKVLLKLRDATTFLHTASLCLDDDADPRSIAVIEKLIKMGLKVDVVEPITRQTPLFFANSIAIIDLLLTHGANIHHVDSNGDTVLFRHGHHKDIVAFLIKKGANVLHKNKANETALFCITDNVDFLNYFLEQGGDINTKNSNGYTALFLASAACLEIMVKREADLETIDKWGITPLLYHLMQNHRSEVNFLLKSGANPNCVDKDHNSPLLLCFKYYCSQLYPDLIEAGADVSLMNLEGETILKLLLNSNHYDENIKKLFFYILKDYPEILEFIFKECILLDSLLKKDVLKSFFSDLSSHPELILAKPHPLELPLLLGDRALASRIIKLLSPEQLEAEMQFIQKKYALASFRWLFDPVYAISTNHYSLELSSDTEIPKNPPEEMSLQKASKTLLEMFDAIQFKDPSKLVDDGSPVTVKKLRENLESLISHLEKRDAFLAVPQMDAERNSYYDKLEKLIRWTVLNLSQFSDSNMKADILYHLAVACGHCGTRYMDGASEAFLDSSTQRKEKVEDLSYKLAIILQALREFCFYQMLQKMDSEQNVHSHNFYLSLIGKARGIPHADAAYSDPIWHQQTSLDEGLKKFDAVYTPAAMIDRIQEALHSQEISFLDFIQMWLKENPPKNWKPHPEMLTILEGELGITLDDIKNDPKDRGIAYAYAMTDMSQKPVRLKKEEERRVAANLLEGHGHINRGDG